ncbi:MAG: hypothetical protein IT513_18650 [Burkholderiales bacterium]|nr:hypothetical protein [Burkholderiales bacterium]
MSVLIFGASYGSLLASKVALAGHSATMVCTPAEAELFNREGAIVRLPVKGRQGLVEVWSRALPGRLSACTPAQASPAGHDFVVMGMQEPQYRSAGVRELLAAVAKEKLPCMSIMNIPPLPYLARIPGVQTASLRDCYAEAAVWDGFDPNLMTLCSPDPQAFRPPEEKLNVLQVRLPTNFKSARFEGAPQTAILRRLEADIEAARFEADGERIELPVKLKVHDSVFVPLAKWAMLLAGNYRCIQRAGVRSIRDAVHGDPETSRSVYDWVVRLCVALGADAKHMVPFEKYAAAAQSLITPSSAARAVAAGASNIERTDRLVREIGAQKGMRSAAIDEIVAVVDARLEANRARSGQ